MILHFKGKSWRRTQTLGKLVLQRMMFTDREERNRWTLGKHHPYIRQTNTPRFCTGDVNRTSDQTNHFPARTECHLPSPPLMYFFWLCLILTREHIGVTVARPTPWLYHTYTTYVTDNNGHGIGVCVHPRSSVWRGLSQTNKLLISRPRKAIINKGGC